MLKLISKLAQHFVYSGTFVLDSLQGKV